uniref:Glycosyltransferase n=1 Tax=Panax notoginseng TaxID=44586 RepID=A0A977R8X9_9APIA|nr:UGT54 [Panax notoginseng]
MDTTRRKAEGGRAQAPSPSVYYAKFQQIGSETLTKLIENLKTHHQSCPIDCIIYDANLPWLIGVVKNVKLIVAAFFTQSCAVGNIYHQLQQGLIRLPLVGQEVVVPGLPPLEPADMPSFVYRLESDILDILLNQFAQIDKVDWVFFNTFYKLEEEVINCMSKLLSVTTIGPTIPLKYLQDQQKVLNDDQLDFDVHLYEPKTSACINWLNQRQNESVAYVSFGSLAQLDAEQMEELAWGLKKSDKYFLWIVRESEEAKLPKGFVEETSDKGLIVRWCSQLEILAHKAIGCFVTHCGWNSILEAISLGVPMVAMPHWSDQSTNAKFVADVWKIGVRVKGDGRGIIVREMVGSCIKEVMDGEGGEGIKRNARNLMEMAREAVKEGGSSDTSTNEFVAKLIQYCF